MSDNLEPNTAVTLRKLLTDLYVSALSYLPDHDDVSYDDWHRLMDTVLDAAEGRRFKALELPWPGSAGQQRDDPLKLVHQKLYHAYIGSPKSSGDGYIRATQDMQAIFPHLAKLSKLSQT